MAHAAAEAEELTAPVVEATTFNAVTHVAFFNDIFQFFGQSFDQWCVCLIGDNCSTHVKVSELCGRPLVGCASHKLNLEVNGMINRCPQLNETLKNIHNVMMSARKLKNSAILRNLTDLAPVVHNQTRGSSHVVMLQRFIEIRQSLMETSEHEDGDMDMNGSVMLLHRCQKYAKMLNEINVVSKSLQLKGHSLERCKDVLDALIETVEQENRNIGSVFNSYKLEKKYISSNSTFVGYAEFENGIAKLQKGLECSSTGVERVGE